MVYVSVKLKQLICRGLHRSFVGSEVVQHGSPPRTHLDSYLSKFRQLRDAIVELNDSIIFCLS